MNELDELLAAAKELAALLRDNYMLPNTWPESRRFLAAVEAFEGTAPPSDATAPPAFPASEPPRA